MSKEIVRCNVNQCANVAVGGYVHMGLNLCMHHYLEGHAAMDETIKSIGKQEVHWEFFGDKK